MKNKFMISIIGIMLTMFITAGYFIFFFGMPVKTEEQALKIAKAHILKKYKKDFMTSEFNDGYKYEIDIYLGIKTWVVSYYRDGWLGGGGPCVMIKQSNGRVIQSYLQK